MAAFDAGFLIFLLHQNPRVPLDPRTRQPVTKVKERVAHLVASLEKAREKILIPTPALSEALTLVADSASDYLSEITNTYGFEIAGFDTMAAIEAAIAASDAKKRGGKKGGSDSTWAKVKFDRQIIAIAKVRGVETIYSNDEDVRKFAEREGIKVMALWDLPEPPPKQEEMFDETEAT